MVGLAPKWVRLAPKGQIRGFFRSDFSTFGSLSQMYLNLIWKSPGFVQFGVQSDPLWSQTYHPCDRALVPLHDHDWFNIILITTWHNWLHFVNKCKFNKNEQKTDLQKSQICPIYGGNFQELDGNNCDIPVYVLYNCSYLCCPPLTLTCDLWPGGQGHEIDNVMRCSAFVSQSITHICVS